MSKLSDTEIVNRLNDLADLLRNKNEDCYPRSQAADFLETTAKRIAPEPPKPREFWIRICPDSTPPELVSKEKIKMWPCCQDLIHVREVMPVPSA